MPWTKRQLVEAAFEEVGLAPHTFELQPERLEFALRRMDAMVAEWTTTGLRIGYNAAGGLNDDSGVSAQNVNVVFLHLALRISPSLGKTVSADTRSSATAAMNALYIAAAQPVQRQQPPDMLRGEGQRPWRGTGYTFMPPPDTSPIAAAQSDNLQFDKD